VAQRLEHVHVVVAAGRVALAAPRLDVMHLELGPAPPAALAGAAIASERPCPRMSPEVVVDEVSATRIAAPASSPRGQGATAPGSRAADVRRRLTTSGKQVIDH
jgi:hypothetical protein